MNLKLTYWNFPFWRAEVSRLALHLGEIPFEDFRPTREEWRALKASGQLPFGQLPVLEVDGEVIAQTAGIARFCGKLGGFYPRDNDLDAARIDQIIDAATELTGRISLTMRVTDLDERLAQRADLARTEIPRWMGYLEQLLIKNEPSDYFVGTRMTIADLAIWRLSEWLSGGILDGVPTDVMDEFPNLQRHAKLIGSTPRIQSWMKQHYR